MREIRLCDDSAFEETMQKCNENNLGIEIQAFADKIIQKAGRDGEKDETEEDVIKKIENEMLRVNSLLLQFNHGISMHACFHEMNVGSDVLAIARVARDYYEKSYEIAKKINCSEIVFHNGYFPGTSYEPNWISRAIKFWKEFLQDKDDTITICIENQFELDSSVLMQIIDGVNDKRLKVCLDIGHAHANSVMLVEQWIETLGDRIAYYHLHNNHGKQNIPGHNDDEHLGLNHGTIDIARVLEKAEQYSPNAIWNLESGISYHLEDIEILKSLGYIKSNNLSI